jgi:PAS domain S-box-containing protein
MSDDVPGPAGNTMVRSAEPARPDDRAAGPTEAGPDWQTRLEPLAHYTGNAVVVLGPGGVVEWVSETFVALTGIGRDDALGRARWDLLRGPFTNTDAYQRFAAEVGAGKATSVEAAVHRPDGSLYWTSITVQHLTGGGPSVRLLCLERDITKTRRMEESARQALIRAQRLSAQLRQEKQLIGSVLSSAPIAVWWKDPEGSFLGCNQAYAQLRGLTSPAEVIGRDETQLALADEVGSALAEVERQVLAGGTAVDQQHLTVTGSDRRIRHYLLSVLARQDQRRSAGVLGVCADVTQMTELQHQVSQSSRLESIGQLAAGIAHEINTPVQYASDNIRFACDATGQMLHALQTLQELTAAATLPAATPRLAQVWAELDLGFLTDEVPGALSQSLEGLDRVAEIVRAMKDYSHPGGERMPTDLNRLVDSTAQVSRSAWKYVAELVQHLDPDLGEVPCYAGDIKQALLNLLVNAAHAIEERRRVQGSEALGTITVTTAKIGQEAVIRVNDDGIGMDEQVARRIFDPFFTTKPVGKGTGQGLSLAHAAIVTKHQGRIDVTSTPMRGSTFTITLPLSATQTGPGEPPCSPPAQPPGQDPAALHGDVRLHQDRPGGANQTGAPAPDEQGDLDDDDIPELIG